MEIVDAYEATGTYRGAATLCGTTHKTVKRVLERQQAGQVGRQPGPPRRRNTDPVQALVAERVRAIGGRISAKRLLPAARAAGYAARRGTCAGRTCRGACTSPSPDAPAPGRRRARSAAAAGPGAGRSASCAPP